MQDLIREFHDSPFGGHYGTQKTISRVSKFYWWQEMTTQIMWYCRNCVTYQLRKNGSQESKQPLTPWSATKLPMTCVAVDTFGPIKQSQQGNTIVLVMMYFLTRFAQTVLQTGFPAELISDAGTNFVSNIVAEICRLLEITKYTVQPLDQKANSLAKRFVATLANSLMQYISANQDDWCECLPFVTFAYNSVEQ